MLIHRSQQFQQWLRKLKDRQAVVRISYTIDRCQLYGDIIGNTKRVDSDIYELKLDFGPGYRIYYSYIDDKIILLTNGGDKSSQPRDIVKARKILEQVRKEKP